MRIRSDAQKRKAKDRRIRLAKDRISAGLTYLGKQRIRGIKTHPSYITLKDAKSLGLIRYFSGIPCPKGHVAERSVSNQHCCTCYEEHKKRYRSKELHANLSPERLDRKLKRQREFYLKNKDKWRKRYAAMKAAKRVNQQQMAA